MYGRFMQLLLLAGFVAIMTGCATTRYPAADDETGFVSIFDGKTLDGWEIFDERNVAPKPDGFYVDDDGNLACKGYNWHWVRYTEPFDDCVLRMDFKVTKGTNSGVCLRSLRTEERPPPFTGFEVQVLDDHEFNPSGKPEGAIFDPLASQPNRHSTGSIYDMVTPMYNASKPHGEWNTLEVVVDNHIVKVTLNGWRVIDTDLSMYDKPFNKFDFAYADMPRVGYLAIQDHGTEVWYRNIRVKKLERLDD